MNATSLREIYNKLYKSFLKKKFDSPRIETELLISKTLKLDKVYIYSYPEKKLKRSEVNKILKNFKLRIKHIPLEYIFHEKEFFGINFFIDKNVLIPRPDTELIVEEVICLVRNNVIKTFADIGTGSGNIVISILKNIDIENIEIAYATDLYKKTLEVAIKNAKLQNIAHKIRFILSDKLDYFIKNNIKLDLIVSNPPYVTEKEYKKLQKEIHYEPKYALVAKDLEFYEYFSTNAKKVLNTNGYLALEINPNFFDKICILFEKNYYKIYKVINDYQKKPRGIIVKFTNG